MRRAQDWKIRCVHEAQMHKHNCFITLTYKRDALPPNASLWKPDFQHFMKRLRARHPELKIRYYMCGEYGPLNGRPHYHANIFNYNFYDRKEAGKSKSGEPYYESAELNDIWGHGRASVQDFTPETAGYTTGYIMKKQLGANSDKAYDIVDEKGNTIKRTPEYNNMSLKPGIGELWYRTHHKDITRHDIAVAHGREHQVPKYYDKLAERHGHVDMEEVKSKRIDKAQHHKQDQTPARLKVREAVTTARLINHERSNDL